MLIIYYDSTSRLQYEANATSYWNQSQDSFNILIHLLLCEGSSKFLLTKVHSWGLFLIQVGEGTAPLRVSVISSVVEHLYDELDGVSDLMSPVQPLQAQAVTDDDQCKAYIGLTYCTWE